MERNILVANTRTQQRHKFTADVTTLGGLKAVLDEKGINYSDMSFTEGISNVQLNDDNSQLPHDVLYKGQVTNSLVIILTNTTKNITSGLMSRAELGAAIKANNLGEAVKSHFGRNWTLVSTADLSAFVLTQGKPAQAEVSAEQRENFDDILSSYGINSTSAEAPVKEPEKEASEDNDDQRKKDAINVLITLVQYFIDEDILYTDMDYDDLPEYITKIFS